MIATVHHFFPTFFPQGADSTRNDTIAKIALAILTSLGAFLLYYSPFLRRTVFLVGAVLSLTFLSESPSSDHPILIEQHLFSPAAPFPFDVVLLKSSTSNENI